MVQNPDAASGAISYALAQVGKPYVYGAAGPDSFDCSGLVYAAYQSQGIGITRTTYTQILQGHAVKESDLLPGDLVFPNPGHVQIYLGDGKIVEAQQRGVPVHVVPIWGFWTARRLVSGTIMAAGGAATITNTKSDTKILNPPASPIPIRVHGTNATFSDATYDAQVGGIWYKNIQKSSNQDVLLTWPISTWNKIVVWTDGAGGGFGSDWASKKTNLAKKAYLADKGLGVNNHAFEIINFMLPKLDTTYNSDPTPLPNLTPENVFGSVTDFLNWLTSEQTWVRLAEIVIGVGFIFIATKAVVK